MILEFFRALLLAGLPVGVASFFLFTWVLRRRAPESVTSLKAIERELKRESKDRARQRKEQRKTHKPGLSERLAEGAHFTRERPFDLVQNKWLKFGGGFYGVVALLTYAVVELRDLWQFAMGFESIWLLISSFGVNTLIQLLVEALQNFILAIAWPAYWLSSVHTQYPWLWFVLAYAGYWAGSRLALRRYAEAASA